jgi:hypothetical protein
VDDGERLEKVEDASAGFLIANHMLEHCENPLGMLRNDLRKVAHGGWLYYAMPDMRCCFDIARPPTWKRAFNPVICPNAAAPALRPRNAPQRHFGADVCLRDSRGTGRRFRRTSIP